MVALIRLLIIAWPLAEIALLILAADQLGIGWTLLALAGGIVLGGLVIRVLGAASLAELQGAVLRREPPAGAMLRGLCVMAAGLLLILPGFLSDVVALLLLIPPLRAAILRLVWRRPPPAPPGAFRAPDGGVILDGEYHELPPAPPPPVEDRSSHRP